VGGETTKNGRVNRAVSFIAWVKEWGCHVTELNRPENEKTGILNRF
jgi:hypothetical protein